MTRKFSLRIVGDTWRYDKDSNGTAIRIELGRNIVECFGNEHVDCSDMRKGTVR